MVFLMLIGLGALTLAAPLQASAEAKYLAMASAAVEFTWLIYLLRDLGLSSHSSPVLFCDNTSALHMTVNLVTPWKFNC